MTTVKHVVEAMLGVMYGQLSEAEFLELFKELEYTPESRTLYNIACYARQGQELELEYLY